MNWCQAILTIFSATNIAAYIVSPANDFANLAPARISIKADGYIIGIIGHLIFSVSPTT